MGFIETIKANTLIYKTFIKNATSKQIETLAKTMIKTRTSNVTAGLLGVTYRCQNACVHCGMRGYRANSAQEMNTAEMKSAIDQIFDMNVVVLNLIGGEPLLREDLAELVAYAADKGMMAKIDTNGWLLDDAMTRTLKDAHVNNFTVSIDAASAEKHDAFRGSQGCWKAAVQAVKNCVRHGIPVTIGTYASHENIATGELEKIIQLGKDLDVAGVRILLPTLAGQWLRDEQQRLTPEEEKKVSDLVDNSFVYWNMYRKCLAAATQTFYVSPHGDVQACAYIPISWGNIREKPLKDIVAEIHQHPFLTDIHPKMCIANDPTFREKYTVQIPEGAELPVHIASLG